MTRLLAVANQKGGVAKTTTVHSLGAALADRGRRVLLVDLDPQACLTFSTGTDPEKLDRSLHDVMVGRADAADVIVSVAEDRPGLPAGDGGAQGRSPVTIDVLPSSIDLAGAEVHLLTRPGREHALKRALQPVAPRYDAVLIDCPPSLGILTINGLTAAEKVLIPLQCETLSHRGVGQLIETIEDVRTFTNPDLQVLGVIATMYDGRTRLAHDTLARVSGEYGLPVLDPPVPKSVRVAEAPGRGCSVLSHAPRSASAEAYRSLAATIDAGRDG